MFSISALADDAPADRFSLSRFYPALKNCLKPVRTSVIDVREAEQVLKLGELIAGSKEALIHATNCIGTSKPCARLTCGPESVGFCSPPCLQGKRSHLS